jgi:Flp pilus assembly protein TadG
MSKRALQRLARRLDAGASDASGAAAAEFALILPLILVMIVAFFEAGRMFWVYNIASSSARDAARYAARLDIDCDSGALATSDEDAVKNLAVTGQVADGGDPLIKDWSVDDVDVSVVCQSNSSFEGLYEGMTDIPTVTVTANAPFQALWASLLPGLGLSQVTVSNSQVWTK